MENVAADIDRITARTSSGGVSVNDASIHAMNPDLPFGGVGESRLGGHHNGDGSKRSAVQSLLKDKQSRRSTKR